MNDTSPEVERLVREKIMARSGEERFVMGAQMFDAAREMIRASLPADLPAAELKRRMFERMYGKSLSAISGARALVDE
jgi:hypothetical protein